MELLTETVEFSPFKDQRPGTSGLRKNVDVFKKPHYRESFVQSIFDFLGESLVGSTLIVGGDGRYYVKETVELILSMCVANKVGAVLVGCDGILSTPAASNLIRKNKAIGGIILTASHNPGGPGKDFGIKFNISNGGPAPSEVTESIYKISQDLKKYKVAKNFSIDIGKIGTNQFKSASSTTIKIIDPVQDYVELMKSIFDFDEIANLKKKPSFGGILLDPMNGVTGPYAEAIFVKELGFSKESLVNSKPLPDFGGLHPDPNLTYAAGLLQKLQKNPKIEFGAAFDGDGDRNMVLGAQGYFVTPSDSLAVIAAFVQDIPYFKKNSVTGFARSMPTAAAVDAVGKALNIPTVETPTGWKFFGNLMDANKVCLCGEESFGTGSDHIREKDGIWAILAWLTILSKQGKTVPELLSDHWKKYGRHYAMRYDYEEVDDKDAKKLMTDLENLITSKDFVGKKFGTSTTYEVESGQNYSYVDPTNGQVTSGQGLIIKMTDGSRIIFRLSGTGSSGSTIRVYFEAYEQQRLNEERENIFKDLVNIALQLSKIGEITKRNAPTVIT